MNLRSCTHCKKNYTAEQVEAIQEECKRRKKEKLLAMYLVLGLAAVIGLFVIYDLELYKHWLG